jgi:Fe-S cluster assembly iron-binding protein IscA
MKGKIGFNMITTQKAAEKLRDNLVQRCVAVGLGFRLVNDNHEHSPKMFSIKVDQACPGDKVLESRGIRIYLDSASAVELENYELDYIDEPGGGFCLKNHEAPDATFKNNK